MANIFGLKSQNARVSTKVDKKDDRPLEPIEFNKVCRDLYYPSRSTRTDEEGNVTLERNPIHDMIDELGRKGVEHDLFIEVVERDGEKILRTGIKCELFKDIADNEGMENWSEMMHNGEIAIEFSEKDPEGQDNFTIEDGANTTYLASRSTEWDALHVDALIALFGTTGSTKTIAHFTLNEGLNFTTLNNRKIDARGRRYSNDKRIKGFAPQV